MAPSLSSTVRNSKSAAPAGAPRYGPVSALSSTRPLAKAGKPLLPFLNPLIYPLIGTAAMRDIAAGSNGAYSAGPGYDMVTGISVPNVQTLAAALLATATPAQNVAAEPPTPAAALATS